MAGRWRGVLAGLALVLGAAVGVAQHRGEPGRFDFYLLNMPWAPAFCRIEGTGAGCTAHGAFVVHGLWPQNADGSWPVYCSEQPGPVDLERNLDITPDLSLLRHEWAKHGTCTTLGPEGFFAAEHRAFGEVRVPGALRGLRQTTEMQPGDVVRMFARANPSFPAGSFAVECRDNRLSAVEACFTKGLQPMACEGIRSCRARVIEVEGAPAVRP